MTGAYTIDAIGAARGHVHGHGDAAGRRGQHGHEQRQHVRRRHDCAGRDADEPGRRALHQRHDADLQRHGDGRCGRLDDGRREGLRRRDRDRLAGADAQRTRAAARAGRSTAHRRSPRAPTPPRRRRATPPATPARAPRTRSSSTRRRRW